MLSSIHFKAASLYLLATLLLTSCASKNDLDVKQASLYFGAGTQSLMEKQYTEALKNLLMANKLDPENSDILNNLGMAYYFKGEEEMAIRTLKSALKINPDNSDAKVNLASMYFKNGSAGDSEKLYKQVLKDLTYDKQARTLYNLGLIELQIKKDNVAAENYFKKSIQEDDNYCPAYHHLGLIQYSRRQFNSALKNFKEATMGTCFNSPAPHYYSALSLIELRRYDEARMKLDEMTTNFKKSDYAIKARQKAIELTTIENKRSSESHASRKVLESPDF